MDNFVGPNGVRLRGVPLYTSSCSLCTGGIFCGMEWGTDRVLEQQLAVARKLGVNVKLLTTKLSDVVSNT